jgi:hypothetical protein
VWQGVGEAHVDTELVERILGIVQMVCWDLSALESATDVGSRWHWIISKDHERWALMSRRFALVASFGIVTDFQVWHSGVRPRAEAEWWSWPAWALSGQHDRSRIM